jgi:uncharacterized OB-fold protein
MSGATPVLDPAASPELAPFREAARAGRLVIPVCRACGRSHWYPRGVCPFCFGAEIDWQETAGDGVIYSYSVMRRATPPYAIAYVTLPEGPSVLTSIIDSDFAQLKIGAAVGVVLKEVADGMFFPFFQLRKSP